MFLEINILRLSQHKALSVLIEVTKILRIRLQSIFRKQRIFIFVFGPFSIFVATLLCRLPEQESLVASVRGCQQFTALRARLAGGGDKTIAEASLDLSLPGDQKPRYSLFLSERSKASNIRFAAFIVPQGKNRSLVAFKLKLER